MADLLTAVAVLDKAFYSDMVTSLDQGLVGITLLIDPDYFWNPTTGLFGSSSFAAVAAAAVDNTNEQQQQQQDFDIVTRIGLMGGGAILLTTLLYHLYFLHDERDERAFLRFKVTTYLAQVALFGYYAWWWNEEEASNDDKNTNETDNTMGAKFLLHRNFFVMAAVIKAFLALWLTMGLYRISRDLQQGTFVVNSDLKHANRYNMAAVIVAMLYALLFAILLSFNPNVLSPAGSMPMYRSPQVAGPENSDFKPTFNALQTAACRFEGIHLLAFTVLLYDLPTVPLQIAELAFTGMILYVFVFQAGWMDSTADNDWRADPVMFRWQMVAHVLLLLMVGGLLGKAKSLMNHRRQKMKHVKEGMIPDLHPEPDDAKVKKE